MVKGKSLGWEGDDDIIFYVDFYLLTRIIKF